MSFSLSDHPSLSCQQIPLSPFQLIFSHTFANIQNLSSTIFCAVNICKACQRNFEKDPRVIMRYYRMVFAQTNLLYRSQHLTSIHEYELKPNFIKGSRDCRSENNFNGRICCYNFEIASPIKMLFLQKISKWKLAFHSTGTFRSWWKYSIFP